jgi:IS4 transposase
MAYRIKESVSCQLQALRISQGLPFRQLLGVEKVTAALDTAKVKFRDRIFNPMVTLWAFLSQVIAHKDSSCEDAVSRVMVDRVAARKKPCSPDTSSYCQARARLPERVIAELTRETGQELHRAAPADWLWKGRHVVIVDGSTVTMADTPENQEEYPQSTVQKTGLGFPILRFVVLLSLGVGTVLECALSACRGKNTGEQSLFRQIWNALRPRDIVLGDRLYDSYRDIALLRLRGVDAVFGKMHSRCCDFRRGRKLGRDDHVVLWEKPSYNATRFESKEQWEWLPNAMEIREVRVTIRRKGYRMRKVIIVTTLLDAKQYSTEDLTDLFSERWHCELDLRSIKQSLGMNHLSCKSPEMVRKELWMHLLAYNLIRLRMSQAAAVHGVMPRRLSFSRSKTLIHNFGPHLNTTCGA